MLYVIKHCRPKNSISIWRICSMRMKKKLNSPDTVVMQEVMKDYVPKIVVRKIK